MAQHHYRVSINWQGNTGRGTADYRAYARDYRISAADKAAIDGSADPAFLGDPTRWNPEELLLAAIAACHKLWYLHLCAKHGITVLAYRDDAKGEMDEGNHDQGGRFTGATLRPHVLISADSDAATALALHHEAHQACFIANSVNFPIHCQAHIEQNDAPDTTHINGENP